MWHLFLNINIDVLSNTVAIKFKGCDVYDNIKQNFILSGYLCSPYRRRQQYFSNIDKPSTGYIFYKWKSTTNQASSVWPINKLLIWPKITKNRLLKKNLNHIYHLYESIIVLLYLIKLNCYYTLTYYSIQERNSKRKWNKLVF